MMTHSLPNSCLLIKVVASTNQWSLVKTPSKSCLEQRSLSRNGKHRWDINITGIWFQRFRLLCVNRVGGCTTQKISNCWCFKMVVVLSAVVNNKTRWLKCFYYIFFKTLFLHFLLKISGLRIIHSDGDEQSSWIRMNKVWGISSLLFENLGNSFLYKIYNQSASLSISTQKFISYQTQF